MVRNIIFDMGQVLIRWTDMAIMEGCGITDPEEKRILKKAMYDTPEWVLMDWGKMDEEDMEEWVKPQIPSYLWPKLHEVLYYWFTDMKPIEGMKDFLKELKGKGYRCYLLSNASRRLAAHVQYVPGYEYLDGCLVSATVEMLKPDPNLFHYICREFGLKEEECLFVDDLKTNCAGARVAGMKSFVFKENIDELRAYIEG